MNKKIAKLYLPSTPLNVLVSCALALQAQKNNVGISQQLWLIDQHLDTDANPYYSALKKWQQSPFESIELFKSKSENLSKAAHRKNLLAGLTVQLSGVDVSEVLVGSDRRIEFQYIMHVLKNTSAQSTVGVYMDDGLYSYNGRPHHWFKDGLNSVLKKLYYGPWWQEPYTVGASSWVEKAVLFQPQQAHSALQTKVLEKLEPEWFTDNSLVSLSSLLACDMGFELDQLKELDFLILIAHPHNVKKMPGYQKAVSELINRLSGSGAKVGVKYHPRSKGEDSLGLMKQGAQCVVPSLLAFEFCLPTLKPECRLIGDVGTAILSAGWLRPDIEANAILNPDDAFQKTFIKTCSSMGVKVLNNFEDILYDA